MSEEKFKDPPAKKAADLPTGLYWKGKKTEVERVVLPFQTIETINESRATREREKKVSIGLFQDKSNGDWHNRLIWGDNKYIMASLSEEFAGKIDLIYIDPPFATGADFSVKMTLGDAEWIKEPSAIEDKAYRDTWGQGIDSYLNMMYERLILMRDLLSSDGLICVHLDDYAGHYIKVILDEIFGRLNFVNQIIWYYPDNFQGNVNRYADNHNFILIYSISPNIKLNRVKIQLEKPIKRDKRVWSKEEQRIVAARDDKGKIIYEVYTEKYADNVWTIGQSSVSKVKSKEHLGYPTQKPEGLLKRIILSHPRENILVADFFCGSGTTGAVAEKLGRRWIMADLGRYAIHTTRKRLLGIDNCKPFVVQNLGKYERQYWQGVTFKKRSDEQMPIYEYIQFILKLYNAEPLTGMLHIHGKKGRHFVHVGAVDAPVTLTEIKETMDEVKQAGQKALDILGWEWEMGLHDVVEKTAKESGIYLRLLSIPRDVMDTRAAEKGDIVFYELAYLEVDVKPPTKDGRFVVELKDFAIPNLDLIPQEVRDKINKWSDYIDYWSVDWDWNEDTPSASLRAGFHNMWQSYRTRKERKLELTSDAHKYENSGDHKIMVKVIDIFGNDTTHVIEVKS
jgi:DNA modification methylase